MELYGDSFILYFISIIVLSCVLHLQIFVCTGTHHFIYSFFYFSSGGIFNSISQENRIIATANKVTFSSLFLHAATSFCWFLLIHFSLMLQTWIIYVQVEVLMAVTMKVAVLWDEIPRNVADKHQHFGGTCFLQIQDWGSRCWKLFTTLHTITSFRCCVYVLNYVRSNTCFYSLMLLEPDTILFRFLWDLCIIYGWQCFVEQLHFYLAAPSWKFLLHIWSN